MSGSINFIEHALEEAVLTTLEKNVGDTLKTHRTAMQDALETLGIEKLAVRLPDGTKVASIVGTNPDPKPVVSDEKQFLRWVEEHAPDEIVEETVTVRRVRPAYLTALTAEMTKRKTAEVVFENGVIVEVDGVIMKEGTRSHSVRFEDGDVSRAAVAAALASGELSHLAALRAFTTGGEE
ncbi:hypothetical protein ACIA7S_28590 [Streptomyces sp. NPDC051643]|uniref:hypothetical protein n=1 Tax=Streptomyces sp. NPDC051643 TaxID=3365665 RepID=UPI003792183A